jgi:hypothetical protein
MRLPNALSDPFGAGNIAVAMGDSYAGKGLRLQGARTARIPLSYRAAKAPVGIALLCLSGVEKSRPD